MKMSVRKQHLKEDLFLFSLQDLLGLNILLHKKNIKIF